MSQLIERGPTLRQVREELEQVFGHLLGVYQLPNGETRPAFWVAGGSQRQSRPPTDWKPQGIECILQQRPTRELLGGIGTIKAMRRWTLTFVCWDTGQTLDDVDLAILRAYPTAQRRHRPQTDEIYEQLTVEIPDPVSIQPL
jgi:hypothetical protein